MHTNGGHPTHDFIGLAIILTLCPYGPIRPPTPHATMAIILTLYPYDPIRPPTPHATMAIILTLYPYDPIRPPTPGDHTNTIPL